MVRLPRGNCGLVPNCLGNTLLGDTRSTLLPEICVDVPRIEEFQQRSLTFAAPDHATPRREIGSVVLKWRVAGERGVLRKRTDESI